jgi:hypothetical protein
VFLGWIFYDSNEENCVIIENADWPGLYFWHKINNVNFGRFYFGRGDKEINAPFIIGNPKDQEWIVDVGIIADYDYKALPEEALKAAEVAFLADEERREKLLPSLPVKQELPPSAALCSSSSFSFT